MTAVATAQGAIVGTVAYMSPEQAEGKVVDGRTDIFSFGSVLYEMVTGQRAFAGDTPLSTVTAVLREEPKQMSHMREDVPRELERVITRCLRKDPERRWQAMSDIKIALRELKEEVDSGAPAASAVPRSRPGRALVGSRGAVARRFGWSDRCPRVAESQRWADGFGPDPFHRHSSDGVSGARTATVIFTRWQLGRICLERRGGRELGHLCEARSARDHRNA